MDYDTNKQLVYWTELENEDETNATLYMSNIGGGDKINFFEEFDTGMVGNPYAIAFDWVGRNLYIANQVYFICTRDHKQNTLIIYMCFYKESLHAFVKT